MIAQRTLSGGFPTKKLADVADFLDSKRRPVTEADRKPGPYPYYGANGQQGSIADFIFDEPLILLAEDGGHFDQPDRGIAYEVTGKVWVNNHAHVLRPKAGIDIRFLRRVLENYDVSPWVTGTTRGKLTQAGAAQIVVPVPPRTEQRRIADILDKADALRTKRRAALAQLDTLAQSMFLEMFGDPAANPRGWPIRTIGELLESASYGTSEKAGTEGEFAVLRMNNITRLGELDLSELKYMDLQAAVRERYLVRKGDILFNRTNSADLVGKTAVFGESQPMAYAGYLIRLRTNNQNVPEYVAAFLNSGYAKRILRSMCKSIIGMANINATEVQAMRVAHPPLGVQRAFSTQLESLNRLRHVNKASLETLDNLFASLQHRAFRGEL